jgi:hypothetical protein
MTTREATIEDWDKLFIFFSKIYRKNHPLQHRDFWIWQYGNEIYGRSFICLNDNDEIVGHVGANFAGGIAWIINVYLVEECRGKGILTELYALARAYYPLAATAANDAGLGLYKKMRWYRYHDLVRYVKINPKIKNQNTENVCKSVSISIDDLLVKDSHYFMQPILKGIALKSGSRAVSQVSVGGLRIVNLVNLSVLEEEAWDLGYNWIDYITSWNDLTTIELERNKWVIDSKSVVPWRINPIQKDYFCDITFLSEKPLDKNFVVHRSFSDHGRIGSLKENNG